MKKFAMLACLVLGLLPAAMARHIKGGEFNYVYLGPGSGNTDRFQVTLRLFLECGAAGQQLDPDANVGIYSNGSEIMVNGAPFIFPLVGDQFITLSSPNPCIFNPSPVCYRLRTYSSIVELPVSTDGYTLVFQRCCRINGLVNLFPNNNIGSSYTLKMYGTAVLGTETNSSPAFAVKDTILICQNRPFTLDFSAQDPDGDSLSYEFCDAYTAAQGGFGGGQIPPSPPSQIGFVNYASGFSGGAPLGANVTINHSTGKIAGIAPAGGDYVISVCVKEWRHGKVLSEHRKDFNLQVDQQCDLAAALLKPDYTNCDALTQYFQNEASSPLIRTYNWDFGIANLTNDTSNLSNPFYTYPDTGVYKVKLVVNRGDPCADSTETLIRLYPGFSTGFTTLGSCVQLPFRFTDTTKARYGTVNYWEWNFGDETSTIDIDAGVRTTTWKYSTPSFKLVTLVVGSSMGCRDTVTSLVEVRDKPIVNLAFRDTLICSVDTLQLQINGPGVYQWSPAYNIIGTGSANPFVYPKQTTWYKVDMNDNGCINSDSVRVRVVDFVTLDAGPDTTICLTDTIRLRPSSDGLRFSWTPAQTLDNPNLKSPLAFPSGNTTYRLTATIGKCNSTDIVNIKTVPYPVSLAGADTTVCFEDTATLHAAIKGSRFTWSPTSTLSRPNALQTQAWPLETTIYTLTVFDTLGCPKPGTSTVTVNVKPRIRAFAGNDTAVVTGQPLQLHATGAPLFQWSPANYLSRTDIADPVSLPDDNFRYILKAYTPEGCFAFDTINIKVFKTPPDIFVPNAFAPNGKNRVLRPIPVGIARLETFSVYNRWGQLVFKTAESGKGWDGTIAGSPQASGTYVWVATGTDYLGKHIIRRGTAILIR